ncbi:hypothetical protein ACJIZ3_022987 [Penstemon smallii]|uniref:Uncharacterized protein n=1 Tax=Penstemon smallii TaxID=265156 RepID=A0ABD3TP55_9LAMI
MFYFTEKNQHVPEPEKVIETLQLFPLNSFNGPADSEKFKLFTNNCKENNLAFTYNMINMETDHPTLDLRLSSI